MSPRSLWPWGGLTGRWDSPPARQARLPPPRARTGQRGLRITVQSTACRGASACGPTLVLCVLLEGLTLGGPCGRALTGGLLDERTRWSADADRGEGHGATHTCHVRSPRFREHVHIHRLLHHGHGLLIRHGRTGPPCRGPCRSERPHVGPRPHRCEGRPAGRAPGSLSRARAFPPGPGVRGGFRDAGNAEWAPPQRPRACCCVRRGDCPGGGTRCPVPGGTFNQSDNNQTGTT